MYSLNKLFAPIVISGMLFLVIGLAQSFQVPSVALHPSSLSLLVGRTARTTTLSSSTTTTTTSTSLRVMTEERKSSSSSAEDTTEKYGLEMGLAQAAKEGDGESAKSLLKKYGIAYLATSIPLALVSFAICYVLVDNGVDVGALLAKVGIENSGAAVDKAGTFAIAYAAHKAASPIRFPPTVLLTPIVAKMIGKEPTPSQQE